MGLFDPAVFSEKVDKILKMDDSKPARRMLLKGAIPVLSTSEMVAALAWLAAEGHNEAAERLDSLPENILLKALEDESLPTAVVEYLLTSVRLPEKVAFRLVKDERISNEVLAGYAKGCSESVAQAIADNQQRLLTAPDVIESLYVNPNTPMSTAMRLIELAVRNGLELRLSAYEEMKRSLEEAEPTPEDELEAELQRAALDQQFRLAQKDSGEEEEESKEDDDSRQDRLPVHLLPVPVKIRLAIMGSRFQRAQLLRDSNKVVAMAAIKSPAITEQEVEEVSKSRQVGEDVIRYISRRRDWLKNYKIRVNLVMNPKTPIPTALSLLNQLRQHDLKFIARSHNIPAAVRDAAQKKLKSRSR